MPWYKVRVQWVREEWATVEVEGADKDEAIGRVLEEDWDDFDDGPHRSDERTSIRIDGEPEEFN